MTQVLQAIRGMNDVLPDQAAVWKTFETAVAEVLEAYGYQSIRMPLVESTDLFVRSIGEVTDIVEKEMYTFVDALNGERLTLRPEGTASCVRAVNQHHLLYDGPKRLWYSGPMFRHERPQKGRYRQFHQIGVEALGFEGAELDAEHIMILQRLWKRLGLEGIRLELNSIGDYHDRVAYRTALIHHFEAHKSALGEEESRRLHTNPMRLLDSKNPDMAEVVARAPSMQDFLGEAARKHIETLEGYLTSLHIPYVLNTRLVRGLDYYNRTVFEWTTQDLGAQATVCGGGRYDTLIEQLGGKPAPACGFAIGVERILLLLEQQHRVVPAKCPDIYVVHQGEAALSIALRLAEQWRDAGHTVVVHSPAGSFKSQMKKADQSGASWAAILGESECAEGKVTLKSLRGEAGQVGQQQTLSEVEALQSLQTWGRSS
jgi:histidyl-tRNA synthetase